MRAVLAGWIAIVIAIALPARTAVAQPAGRGGEDDSAAFVEEGRAALRKRDYKRAATALDEALRLNPRRIEAYVLRTAVYSAEGDHKAGVELMKRAQGLAPTDIDVLTALGTQLVLAGEPADGVPLLQQVVAKVPERYDAQLLLGEHWHAAGAWPDAITAFEAYFASRPDELNGDDPDHQIDLADSYLRYRQPAKALPLFARAAAARPRDLRARIGVAWATAATDCSKARPLLAELRADADKFPAIWLVDGQCALATGDVKAALELGQKYLAASPNGSAACDGAAGAAGQSTGGRGGCAAAAGHALVGEAEAARGDLAGAKAELGEARRLEPDRRRWAVRLAHVLRDAGDAAGAKAELDAIGPPAQPGLDPAWWSEVGEALIATDDAAAAVKRLAPVAAELATDAGAQTVYGIALAKTGATADAIAPLEAAIALRPDARGKTWLAYALGDVGTRALAAGDTATAEARLGRAVEVDPSPALWKNLGVARLVTGGDAIAPLEQATAGAGASDPVAFALLGRARAKTDPAGARTAYGKALALAKGATLVETAIDAAAFELAAGEPANAVADLEPAAAAAKAAGAPLVGTYKAAVATARHAAGLAALRAGQAGKAVDHLEAAAAATGGEDHDVRCDLAIATVVGGDRDLALRRLKAVAGKPCPFPAPADTQAIPILIAFVEGRQEKKAVKALAKLAAIDAKATGSIKALVAIAIRVVALEAADDAYRRGKTGQAAKLLAEAKKVQSRAGADELAHNLAVLDLADGKLDAAIAVLDKSKLPEALVNLGIAYDKKGDPRHALEAWRKARRAGVKFGPLADWIEAKEQIYGGDE